MITFITGFNPISLIMRIAFYLITLMLLSSSLLTEGAPIVSTADKQDLFSIRIYEMKTKEQEDRVDKYLQEALLPALLRQGLGHIGVFKPVGNDTAAFRRIYVLIPFHSADQFVRFSAELLKDKHYLADGKEYLDATYSDPPYVRIESILLQAFPGMPQIAAVSTLKGPAAERIYELRSYEGPTEKYFQNKMQMFNEGGEIGLFKRLNFNAVFYASVLSGAHMPNLMYMTSFENMDDRNAHWKTFGDDPFWKQLVASPEYQHNVSHVDIVFLHPTGYSAL